MEERIRTIMSAVFDLPLESINDESSPDSIESWDSLKHINLVVALEEEFEINFTDNEILEIINFKLIKKIVESLLE